MTRPSPSAMTIRRLEWTLRARGPDIAAWPERERSDALDLARSNPDARELLAAALAEEAPPPVDPLAQARMQDKVRHALTPLSRSVRWTTMAAFLLAGLYLGLPPLEAEFTDLVPTIQATTPATMLAALNP